MTENHLRAVVKIVRTGGETTRFPEEVNRQHSWTAQKNSRKDVMADQRTAKTVVKKRARESTPDRRLRRRLCR